MRKEEDVQLASLASAHDRPSSPPPSLCGKGERHNGAIVHSQSQSHSRFFAFFLVPSVFVLPFVGRAHFPPSLFSSLLFSSLLFSSLLFSSLLFFLFLPSFFPLSSLF